MLISPMYSPWGIRLRISSLSVLGAMRISSSPLITIYICSPGSPFTKKDLPRFKVDNLELGHDAVELFIRKFGKKVDACKQIRGHNGDYILHLTGNFYAIHMLNANNIARVPMSKSERIVQARSKTGFLPQRDSPMNTAGAPRI